MINIVNKITGFIVRFLMRRDRIHVIYDLSRWSFSYLIRSCSVAIYTVILTGIYGYLIDPNMSLEYCKRYYLFMLTKKAPILLIIGWLTLILIKRSSDMSVLENIKYRTVRVLELLIPLLIFQWRRGIQFDVNGFTMLSLTQGLIIWVKCCSVYGICYMLVQLLYGRKEADLEKFN